jgi:predicted ribosome quality control (RQC) complex YloA/Tae2 family protein
MTRLKRVPFDSLSLATIVQTLNRHAGAKVQRVTQLGDTSLAIALYSGTERSLVLDWSADRPYMGFTSLKLTKSGELSPFGLELRRRLVPGRMVGAHQIGCDRIAELRIETPEGAFRLVVEVMGKHSNVVLVDHQVACVAAAKWVGPKLSQRPILPGKTYHLPPVEGLASFLDATALDEAVAYDGLSPFLRDWIAARGPGALEKAQAAFLGDVRPSQIPGLAPYPLPLAPDAVAVSDFAEAFTAWAIQTGKSTGISSRVATLRTQLGRLAQGTQRAVDDLTKALDVVARAGELQQIGQGILAYAFSLPPGASEFELWMEDGTTRIVPLRPGEAPQVQADRYFQKAKRAKLHADEHLAILDRLTIDLNSLRSVLVMLEGEPKLEDVEFAEKTARDRRWVHAAAQSQAKKEDRPYAGHAIRELMAPGGWKVLYGDNSTANDFLTTKVGKPNDWWLHVRGGPSTHVLIPTHNQPQRVPPQVLQYAALVAAKHSPSKHSTYVAVDITLKKYVRKPKGAGVGLASYTHERTLHVNATDSLSESSLKPASEKPTGASES